MNSSPLEIREPHRYGKFDASQLRLIRDGAYDLLLIENATELFREVMHELPDSIEQMLSALPAYSNCSVLESETFPYYISTATKKRYPQRWDDSLPRVPKNTYQAVVKSYRKKIPKNPQWVLAVLALDLGVAGGHYAAFIHNRQTNELIIFDSMSYLDTGSSTKTSPYFPFFSQLARDLFGTVHVTVPSLKNLSSFHSGTYLGWISLQETGGNPENVPVQTSLSLVDPGTQKLLANQSPESQNHFCYMWAIWYLHIVTSGWSFNDILKQLYLLGLDPLVVIKRYSWSMFKLTGLDNNVRHKDLFYQHFPRVWMYGKVCEIEMSECSSASACLQNSISAVSLREVPPTPQPSGWV